MPSSFRLIIGALHLSGKSDLALLSLESAGGEFFAVLGRNEDVGSLDVGALLVEAQREERDAAL